MLVCHIMHWQKMPTLEKDCVASSNLFRMYVATPLYIATAALHLQNCLFTAVRAFIKLHVLGYFLLIQQLIILNTLQLLFEKKKLLYARHY